MDYARYLDIALKEAEQAQSEGSLPAGSVIVASGGRIVSHGRNRVRAKGDQTAHSEIEAIRDAGAVIAPSNSSEPGAGYTLYTSAEPCLMCLGAIMVCNIDTIVWAASAATGSAYDSVLSSDYQNQRINALKVVREPSTEHRLRSRRMLREFFLKQGNLQRADLYFD